MPSASNPPLDAAHEQVSRELGAKRMKQAIDRAHEALANMGLVVTALDGLVDGHNELDDALGACNGLRRVRDNLKSLANRLAASGGPRVTTAQADFEIAKRQQR